MIERSLLTVVTPAMAKRLVPVATVRSELGIPDTSEDAKIGALIDALSREFAGMNGLQRPLLRQTYRERLRFHEFRDELDGSILSLGRWPIESVSSVATAADDEVVDPAEYEIALEHRSALYRECGWSCGVDYLATYIAGWVPAGDGPGLVLPWSAIAVKVAGAWAKPVAAANGENPLLFQCTTAGTTGASEPAWPTTAGLTVVDGSVTWTARTAAELPEDIQLAALVTATAWYGGSLDIPIWLKSESRGSVALEYDTVNARHAGAQLPAFAKTVLESYR